jgi:DNA-binding MarR family transcriptional regulator
VDPRSAEDQLDMDLVDAVGGLFARLHCDPSFVTGIADMLEKRGLAVREPDPADRRVKRLVLTSAGLDMKHQMEQAMLARMPWRQSLTVDERAALISLLHKMTPPMSDLDTDCPGEEVTSLLATATAPQVS